MLTTWNARPGAISVSDEKPGLWEKTPPIMAATHIKPEMRSMVPSIFIVLLLDGHKAPGYASVPVL